MASDQKTLVFDDVSKHNKIEDCWLIISGKVYDVTPFMDDHPGGNEVMLGATGKDATTEFGDVGHSVKATALMDKYYIGEIDEATIPAKRSYGLSAGKIYNSDTTPELVKILQFLLPFVILGLAFTIFRAYMKEESA